MVVTTVTLIFLSTYVYNNYNYLIIVGIFETNSDEDSDCDYQPSEAYSSDSVQKTSKIMVMKYFFTN